MILQEESIEDYHGQPCTTLSKTRLMDFKSNGAPWWKLRYIDKVIPDKDTKALRLGRALDTVLTVGWDAFEKLFVVISDDCPRRPTKKQLAAPKKTPAALESISFWAQYEGMDTIFLEDSLILNDAVNAVIKSPYWPMLEESDKQVTFRRELTDEGIPGISVQSRPDFLNFQRGKYIDLKMTRDFATFGRDAINFGYHTQCSLTGALALREGIELEDYSLLAVEWERGARCELFTVPEIALTAGWRESLNTVREISERMKKDDWLHRPSSNGTPLNIPGYTLAKMENDAS